MKEENLTLKQLLKKYPYLAEIHLEEYFEQEEIQEKQDNKKKLLLG